MYMYNYGIMEFQNEILINPLCTQLLFTIHAHVDNTVYMYCTCTQYKHCVREL